MYHGVMTPCIIETDHHMTPCTARSVKDETRNAELNGNRNSEWWGDFSQLVKIKKSNLSESDGTKRNSDFDRI